MQELIKKIRSHMNMNQTDFVEQLNVTFATVNRWENGRALPNQLAQDKIYDLCQKYDVPVYDMVLEKIETASRSIEEKDCSLMRFWTRRREVKHE